MQTATIIDNMQTHIQRSRDGLERVKPGQRADFNDAHTPGDMIRQGDLYITKIESVPTGYTRVEKPTEADRQLVPGNTEGAKHCLSSLDGVTLHRSKNHGQENNLDGPCVEVTKPVDIMHPTHGHVGLTEGTYSIGYQREYDRELEQERRAAD